MNVKRALKEALILMLIVMIDCAVAAAAITWWLAGAMNPLIVMGTALLSGILSLIGSVACMTARCPDEEEEEDNT